MFISLDLETTGFDSIKDKIIEFGAVKFDLTGKKEELQFLVNPGITLPQIIPHLTGIHDKDLKDQPAFSEKAQEIKEFIGDLPIIGHNIQFDTGFLRENGIELSNPEYDTCALASILLPGLPSYSLEILSTELDLQHKEKHRALDDSIAAMELFIKLAAIFQDLDENLISKIHKLCDKTNWSFKDFLKTLTHKKLEKTANKEKSHPIAKEKDTTPLPKELTDNQISLLIETDPPYLNNVSELCKTIEENTFIAIPNQTFSEISKDLPENITKIDSPERYLSPKRLEAFENKPFFEDFEFTSLLKYLIWSTQTKTGHLSEITLFNQEKTTLPQINQEQLIHPKTTPAICSHQYLIEMILTSEEPPKIDTLYIIDSEKFIKELFFFASSYIKLDLLLNPLKELQAYAPENQTVKSLISKSTIIFGLIGMLFEKYNDNNQFIRRCQLKPALLETKEWADLNSSIKNLIETSKELIDIKNEETQDSLRKWKEILRQLQEIFLTPNLEEYLTLIEQDYFENIVIKGYPYQISDLSQKVLNSCKTYKIICENLDLGENGDLTKKLLGIQEDLQIIKTSKRREDFDIYINNDPDLERNILKGFLAQYIETKKGNLAIILTSRQQLSYFTLELGTLLKDTDIQIISQLTGSLGKITEKFKEDPENSILLLTPNYWENFQAHDLINTLVIQKIPFDPPSDPFVITLGQTFKDPFNEFQIPRGVLANRKILNMLPHTATTKEIVMLDNRLVSKDYGKPILENLNNLATTKIVNLATLNSGVKQNDEKTEQN